MELTSEIIEQARAKTADTGGYSLDAHHEHDDCIRIAYHWLDAQTRTKNPGMANSYKTIIENWAGRYVSVSDVEVAATLLGLVGGYRTGYNLSRRLTRPRISRLDGIGEAFTQNKNSTEGNPSPYRQDELEPVVRGN